MVAMMVVLVKLMVVVSGSGGCSGSGSERQ